MSQKPFAETYTTVDLTLAVMGPEHLAACEKGSEIAQEISDAISKFLSDDAAVKAAFDPIRGCVVMKVDSATTGMAILIANQLTHVGLITHVLEVENGHPLLCFPVLM